MPDRSLPVRPDLEQLRRQAKDLLRALRRGDPEAAALLREHHPSAPAPTATRLADAQHALARSYGAASWPRLVVACRLVDAIWRDDPEAVREIVSRRPELLDEPARGIPSHWGPPMSYAANLGRDRIVEMLRAMGAGDLDHALDRACLQGRIGTARRLLAMGAVPSPDLVMGPCETLHADGLAFVLTEVGLPLADGRGDRLAPVALLLQTYARWPEGKHRCLELVAAHGVELPDTPAMAAHRGRIDLLERHLARDPGLVTRPLTHEEIWPPALGCSEDRSLALHGTPLAGATLLHFAVDYDEAEIGGWLLERGAADARAAVDAEGFGGHTPLFNAVVSQAARCGRGDGWARSLLERGADPRARASLRKRLRFVGDEVEREYRDVTPLEWGERFHEPDWACGPALALLRARDRGLG